MTGFSILAVLITAFITFTPTECCNEALCASVVSKCMLTESCRCDLKNCSCCKDCFYCLGSLFSDCCSCVGMCPKRINIANSLSRKSHVEDFSEPQSVLFNALTSEPDTLKRWTTYTFPAHKKINKDSFHNGHLNLSPSSTKDIANFNCTVAYISQCVSWNKCKMLCQSMGSSSYRWFHDGCCECVGPVCVNYGISESSCSKCPLRDEDEDNEEEEESSENQYNAYSFNSENDIFKGMNSEFD